MGFAKSILKQYRGNGGFVNMCGCGAARGYPAGVTEFTVLECSVAGPPQSRAEEARGRVRPIPTDNAALLSTNLSAQNSMNYLNPRSPVGNLTR